MPMLQGPDCRLWIERLGEGTPVTIFAHGVTSSTDELAPLAARTPGTRVLLDFRGHGASDCPPADAGYDLLAMRRDLECVADATGATRAFGTSMGAGALLNLLADDPGRFDRVVLFIPASVDDDARDAEEIPPLAHLLEVHPLELVAERALAAPEQIPLFAKRPYWRALVRRRILRMNSTGVPRALREYTSGPPPLRDVDALRAVTVPVLILAHEGDAIHDVAHARRLARVFPNAQLKVWPEPLAMYDDLDAFAGLIGEFLSR